MIELVTVTGCEVTLEAGVKLGSRLNIEHSNQQASFFAEMSNVEI
jgi:hypothetical protein